MIKFLVLPSFPRLLFKHCCFFFFNSDFRPVVIKGRKSHQKRQKYDNRFQLLVEFIENSFHSFCCRVEHLWAFICLRYVSLLRRWRFRLSPIQCRQFACLPIFIIWLAFKGDLWVVIVSSIYLSALVWVWIFGNSPRLSVWDRKRDSGDLLSIDHNQCDMRLFSFYFFYINTKGTQKMWKFKKETTKHLQMNWGKEEN